MNAVLISFCVSFIVLAALVAVAIIFLKPRKKEEVQNALTGNTIPPRKGWKGWLPFFVIALILAIWTIWGALFFLGTVWVMRLNPKADSKEIPFPSDKDRKRAKGMYTWLLLSPFLTVPTMIITALNLDWNSSPNQRVFAALIPAIFHLLLLFQLDSKRPFVYRHTQQGILLVALRASMAALALNISKYPDDGIWLFLLGNGSLWLFGTLWGRNQVVRSDCWWMRRRGEIILPLQERPIEQPITDDELDAMVKGLDAEGSTARQKALNAFREGTPETRKKAVLVLSKLGEVEKF